MEIKSMDSFVKTQFMAQSLTNAYVKNSSASGISDAVWKNCQDQDRVEFGRQTEGASFAASQGENVTGQTVIPSGLSALGRQIGRMVQTIEDYYREANEENLRFENPYDHICEKYKWSDSSYFRSDLSAAERDIRYRQEVSFLRSGTWATLNDPYAMEAEGGVKNIWQMQIAGNQEIRKETEEAVNRLLAQSGIQLPEGTTFRLTVVSDNSILVSKLEDQELAHAIEAALNQGDNGKNLLSHIQACGGARSLDYTLEHPLTNASGEAGGLRPSRYAGGHLLDVNTSFGYGAGQTGWQKDYLEHPEKARKWEEDVAADRKTRWDVLRKAHQGETGLFTIDGEFSPQKKLDFHVNLKDAEAMSDQTLNLKA